VGDGDTLDVRGGDRVRLVQIDAPELREGECDADELLDAVDEARRERRGMWGSCRVSWDPRRAVATRPR